MDAAILRVFLEISKISSTVKAWRLQVGDAFNEARFFQHRWQEAQLWKPLICALMDSDKEWFKELLGESKVPHWPPCVLAGSCTKARYSSNERCSINEHIHKPRAGNGVSITESAKTVIRPPGGRTESLSHEAAEYSREASRHSAHKCRFTQGTQRGVSRQSVTPTY